MSGILLGITPLFLTGCNKSASVAASDSPAPAASSAAGIADTQNAAPTPSPTPTPLEKVKLTEPVRGIYISGWTAGGTKRWGQLLDLVDKTEINSVVIDVKEDGMMSYKTDIPLAIEANANFKMISNIDAKMEELRKRKVYSIARITCFRDAVMAKKRPDLAVQRLDGKQWTDKSGHYWLDAYNKKNWDYNVDVAIDAAKRGFNEVQWDYVRFPSEGSKANRVYPAKAKDDKRSEAKVISEFLAYAKEKLKPYDVKVTADIFGLTVSAKPDDDMGIGQKIDLMIPNLDVISPMVYPSHYARGEYGIPNPNAAPYRTISKALDYAVPRVKGTNCTIRPWLQDFSLGVRYGVPEVKAQIKALREHGIEEYLLWNAGNRYTSAALIPPKQAKKKVTTETKKPDVPAANTTAKTPASPAKVTGIVTDGKTTPATPPAGSPTPAATP